MKSLLGFCVTCHVKYSQDCGKMNKKTLGFCLGWIPIQKWSIVWQHNRYVKCTYFLQHHSESLFCPLKFRNKYLLYKVDSYLYIIQAYSYWDSHTSTQTQRYGVLNAGVRVVHGTNLKEEITSKRPSEQKKRKKKLKRDTLAHLRWQTNTHTHR